MQPLLAEPARGLTHRPTKMEASLRRRQVEVAMAQDRLLHQSGKQLWLQPTGLAL